MQTMGTLLVTSHHSSTTVGCQYKKRDCHRAVPFCGCYFLACSFFAKTYFLCKESRQRNSKQIFRDKVVAGERRGLGGVQPPSRAPRLGTSGDFFRFLFGRSKRNIPQPCGPSPFQQRGATNRKTALCSVPKKPVRQSSSATGALSFSMDCISARISSSTLPPYSRALHSKCR